MTQLRRISILGSSGSIGRSTLEVIRRNPERFAVDTLTAMDNVALLAEQAREFNASLAVIGKEEHYGALKEALAGADIEIAAGQAAIEEAAQRPVDMLVAAIVGAAGLKPVLAALSQGICVALANKECLITAGEIMLACAKQNQAAIIPVDSEHSAIFQAIDAHNVQNIDSITITASGGPFRLSTLEEMRVATPAQAVRHPTWSMGAKISVDSATMMNKGLELIEAYYLFPVKEEQLQVVVHPESIIHALVSYLDGSVLAQMSIPDMRTPIAYALGWPQRIQSGTPSLKLQEIGSLSFAEVDDARFPAPMLARRALRAGASATIALNAANEVAVDAFLKERTGFLDITKIVEKTLEKVENAAISSVEDILAADASARRIAHSFIS